jgi:hypothetical protein
MSMSIRETLNQLKSTYGKLDTMMLLANNTLFCSPFNPIDAPEALFYRIEECQEIQVLARDPYSDMQVINNAVRLLMQVSIFPLNEFDNWEAITPKTYPALSRLSLQWCIQDALLRSNSVTLQGSRGTCRHPIICTTCLPKKTTQKQ